MGTRPEECRAELESTSDRPALGHPPAQPAGELTFFGGGYSDIIEHLHPVPAPPALHALQMRTMGLLAEPPLAENGVLACVYLRSKCFDVKACLGKTELSWPERKIPSTKVCCARACLALRWRWFERACISQYVVHVTQLGPPLVLQTHLICNKIFFHENMKLY